MTLLVTMVPRQARRVGGKLVHFGRRQKSTPLQSWQFAMLKNAGGPKSWIWVACFSKPVRLLQTQLLLQKLKVLSHKLTMRLREVGHCWALLGPNALASPQPWHAMRTTETWIGLLQGSEATAPGTRHCMCFGDCFKISPQALAIYVCVCVPQVHSSWLSISLRLLGDFRSRGPSLVNHPRRVVHHEQASDSLTEPVQL